MFLGLSGFDEISWCIHVNSEVMYDGLVTCGLFKVVSEVCFLLLEIKYN